VIAAAFAALALAPWGHTAKLDCPGDPFTTGGALYGVGPRNTVIGLPGRVAMRRGSRWDVARVGGRLGASAATADLDGDSCFDLVAGAPGRGPGGAVVVLRGARRTIRGTATVLRPRGVRRGDRFGAAVALSGGGGFQPTELWIGAPGRDVRGHRDAGAIYRYRVSGKAKASLVGMYTAGTRAIDSRPEAGDRLGSVLAAVSNGVVAGVPDEDVGDAVDAGAVEYLRVKGRRTLRGQHLDQSSDGRETPEAGDRFGAAVAGHGDGAWAGAPGEDLPDAADAGLIENLDRRGPAASRRPLRAVAVVSQGSRKGVPGVPEAGDRFGAAIAQGFGINCQEDSSLKVGAPGQDVDGVPDAGSVSLLALPAQPCDARELARGHGLAGAPVAGERAGASLGITLDRPGLDEDEFDTLLASAPGSGAVLTLHGDFEAPEPGVLEPPPGFRGAFALTYP
jgi:FG-GAP repeat